jgi:hypothetical protein
MNCPLLAAVLGLLFTTTASAAPPEVIEGWTVETLQNPAEKADFNVRARKVADGVSMSFAYRNLFGDSLNLEFANCGASNNSSLIGLGDPLKENAGKVRTAVAEAFRAYKADCKIPAGLEAKLMQGFDKALENVIARFNEGKPVLISVSRAETRGGWTLEDVPTDPADALGLYRELKMNRSVGGLEINYTLALDISSENVRSGNRAIAATFKECSFEELDQTDYLSASRRARELREQIGNNMPIAISECGATPGIIGAGITGFEAAYVALDSWAVQRIDERLALNASAAAFMGDSSGSAVVDDDKAM